VPGSRRSADRRRIIDRDGYQCHYCQVSITVETGTVDHIVPRCRGGTYSYYNLVASCYPCNLAKLDQPSPCGCWRCKRALKKDVQRRELSQSTSGSAP